MWISISWRRRNIYWSYNKNIIPKKNTVKYLGQYINHDGRASAHLKAWTYGTIGELLHNTTKNYSRSSRIKLYKTFIKAKFTHLIPLLTVSGKLKIIEEFI